MRHMPEGCGYVDVHVESKLLNLITSISTWPAVWEVGDDWPNQGEVDIVEGVNNVSPNQATLHTAAGKTLDDSFFSFTSPTSTSSRMHDAYHKSLNGGVRGNVDFNLSA